MAHAAKIACSIDAKLLARVESIRARTGESRSALVSRALLALTREAALARDVARYVQAYQEQPETSDEIDAARKSARRALSGLRWNDR